MDEIETARAVRAWLNTLPGMVEAETPEECLRKGWAAFGKAGLEPFRNALAREGFLPEALGRVFILRLPSKPIAGADWGRIRRVNNIAG